jgi:hypothetical protein
MLCAVVGGRWCASARAELAPVTQVSRVNFGAAPHGEARLGEDSCFRRRLAHSLKEHVTGWNGANALKGREASCRTGIWRGWHAEWSHGSRGSGPDSVSYKRAAAHSACRSECACAARQAGYRLETSPFRRGGLAGALASRNTGVAHVFDAMLRLAYRGTAVQSEIHATTLILGRSVR